MKTLSELRNYYNTTLLPELRVLEAQRKKALNKILIAALVIIPLAIILAFIMKDVVFPGIVAFGFLVGITAFVSKKYVSNFKTEIIGKIVTSVEKNLIYSKRNRVAKTLFMASQIFKHRIDVYKGDDHVRGKLGKTNSEFSEIHAQYVTRDSKGRRNHHTIFKGLFFIADFSKHFKGKTFILPDKAERFLGGLGAMFQSWNKTRGQLIKLEDPEFEKYFVVYGSDQIEARYILSTSLMKRIVDFKKKTGKSIYFSFIATKIFVAIPYRRNLFEPRIFRTILDFTPIQQYFEDLQLAVGIVDDLNLNTRIWGKQ